MTRLQKVQANPGYNWKSTCIGTGGFKLRVYPCLYSAHLCPFSLPLQWQGSVVAMCDIPLPILFSVSCLPVCASLNIIFGHCQPSILSSFPFPFPFIHSCKCNILPPPKPADLAMGNIPSHDFFKFAT